MNLCVFFLPLALLLSGCLDALVGEECANGYMLCGNACLPVAFCPVGDGGQDGLEVMPDCLAMDASIDSPEDAPEADVGVLQDAASPGDVEDDAGNAPLDAPVVQVDAAAVQVDTALDTASYTALDIASDIALDIPVDQPEASGSPDTAVAIAPDAGDAGMDLATDTVADSVVDQAVDLTVVIVLDAGESDLGDGGDADTGGDLSTDASVADADPLVTPDAFACPGNLMVCGEACVDPSTDRLHCGGCGTTCDATSICLLGACIGCDVGQHGCGSLCVDLSTDPDNCGTCGVPCGNGICSNGRCEARGTGRVIVIGHDYLTQRRDMNRILGNAVLLWPSNPVRLLVYSGYGNDGAIAGADIAISQVAGATGRQYNRIPVTAAEVPSNLPLADVLLVNAQEHANNVDLIALGVQWRDALTTFVNNGGTVVVLDAIHAGNDGTTQILGHAGLFTVTSRTNVTGDICTVTSRGDAVSTGLPTTYRCYPNSVGYTTVETNMVVQSTGNTAVVIHKVF